MHGKRQGNRCAGFTLAEVLTALLIFGIVAVGGMTFFVYGRNHINAAATMRLGLELARAKIETLKATPYGDISSSTEVGLPLGALLASRTATVTEQTGASGTYKQITVYVRWPQSSPQHEIRLDTLVAAQ